MGMILFQDFFDEQKVQKNHLFEIEIFYKIINVFTVTFDLFNASLMNKSIHFWPKLLNDTVHKSMWGW